MMSGLYYSTYIVIYYSSYLAICIAESTAKYHMYNIYYVATVYVFNLIIVWANTGHIKGLKVSMDHYIGYYM